MFGVFGILFRAIGLFGIFYAIFSLLLIYRRYRRIRHLPNAKQVIRLYGVSQISLSAMCICVGVEADVRQLEVHIALLITFMVLTAVFLVSTSRMRSLQQEPIA